MCVSQGSGNRGSGALANAVTESRRVNLVAVVSAEPSCPQASDAERFFVTMPAERLSHGKMTPNRHLRLSNYRGQNPQFMWLFPQEKRRSASRVIRESLGAFKTDRNPSKKSKQPPNEANLKHVIEPPWQESSCWQSRPSSRLIRLTMKTIHCLQRRAFVQFLLVKPSQRSRLPTVRRTIQRVLV
jgi:hypothetical protein